MTEFMVLATIAVGCLFVISYYHRLELDRLANRLDEHDEMIRDMRGERAADDPDEAYVPDLDNEPWRDAEDDE